jgi:hypothetical protein
VDVGNRDGHAGTVTLPLTDLSAATLMMPIPEADVSTGGIS